VAKPKTSRPGPGSEGRPDEAVRHIAEGRLTILFMDGDSVAAMCRDADAVHDLGYEPGRGWWCDCDAAECAHLGALKLVTERAVRARERVSAPAELGLPVPAGPETSGVSSPMAPSAPLAGGVPAVELDRADGMNEPEAELESGLEVAADSRSEAKPDFLPDSEATPEAVAVAAEGVEVDHPSGDAPSPLGKARRRRFRSRGLLIIAGIVIIAAAAWASSRQPAEPRPRKDGAPAATPAAESVAAEPVIGPPPSPAASPAPSPVPSPSAVPANDPVTVSFPKTARGNGLFVTVRKLDPNGSNCLTHELGTTGVYQSACGSWSRVGSLYWIQVSVANHGLTTIHLRTAGLELVGAGGAAHRPIGVRRFARRPEALLAARMDIRPGHTVTGWVSYDARSGFVPRSLRLDWNGEPIRIRFFGSFRSVRSG